MAAEEFVIVGLLWRNPADTTHLILPLNANVNKKALLPCGSSRCEHTKQQR